MCSVLHREPLAGLRFLRSVYDHASQRISVALEAFTRLASITGDGEHLPQSWLPPGERVTEHLPHSEEDGFVKDVFHSWIKKLRAAIPADLVLRP